MSGGTFALVPIRSLSAGKTRLSGAVDAEARAELIRLMLRNVLRALAETTGIDRIAVVSPDHEALGLAAELLPNADLVAQPVDHPGLLPALEIGRAHARDAAADALMIVFGDLPRLSAPDLTAMLASTADVVIAPDRDRSGTNVLLLRRQAIESFLFRFGDQSFPAHIAEADRRGLATTIVDREGLSFDLDTPGDLAMLATTMTTMPWKAAS